MRSYILVPALAALNWGITPAAAIASTKNTNGVARPLPFANSNITRAHRFEHKAFPRQYRAEDWASNPHGDRSRFPYSHGAGKRSLEVVKRVEGEEDWLKSREVVAARGSHSVCMRRKGSQSEIGKVTVEKETHDVWRGKEEKGGEGKTGGGKEKDHSSSVQGGENGGAKGGGLVQGDGGRHKGDQKAGGKVGGSSGVQGGGMRHKAAGGKQGEGSSSVKGGKTLHASSTKGGKGGKQGSGTRRISTKESDEKGKALCRQRH